MRETAISNQGIVQSLKLVQARSNKARATINFLLLYTLCHQCWFMLLENLTKYRMPSGWVLLDLLTRKIKLRCIKITGAVLGGTLPLETVRIRIYIYQTVGSRSISSWKTWSGFVSKGYGSATLLLVTVKSILEWSMQTFNPVHFWILN